MPLAHVIALFKIVVDQAAAPNVLAAFVVLDDDPSDRV
jgi:hypothetical protein